MKNNKIVIIFFICVFIMSCFISLTYYKIKGDINDEYEVYGLSKNELEDLEEQKWITDYSEVYSENQKIILNVKSESVLLLINKVMFEYESNNTFKDATNNYINCKNGGEIYLIDACFDYNTTMRKSISIIFQVLIIGMLCVYISKNKPKVIISKKVYSIILIVFFIYILQLVGNIIGFLICAKNYSYIKDFILYGIVNCGYEKLLILDIFIVIHALLVNCFIKELREKIGSYEKTKIIKKEKIEYIILILVISILLILCEYRFI